MDERETYAAKLDAELRELSARLELLRARTAHAAVDARLAIERELEVLTGQSSTLQRRLHELRSMSAAGWERLKDGVDAARRDLANGLETLAKKLR